jgi:hypothetical protein
MKTEKAMRYIVTYVAVIAVTGLILSAPSSARQGLMWKGSGGWGMGSSYNRMYDSKTVESIRGEVAGVDTITPAKGMSTGVHLTLKTVKETVSVHLGPAWYIENQDIKIELKDVVEITGSRITFEGKPAILAAVVKKGDEILRLRDGSGIPVWSGWRKG